MGGRWTGKNSVHQLRRKVLDRASLRPDKQTKRGSVFKSEARIRRGGWRHHNPFHRRRGELGKIADRSQRRPVQPRLRYRLSWLGRWCARSNPTHCGWWEKLAPAKIKHNELAGRRQFY